MVGNVLSLLSLSKGRGTLPFGGVVSLNNNDEQLAKSLTIVYSDTLYARETGGQQNFRRGLGKRRRKATKGSRRIRFLGAFSDENIW